jgi:hypothetical protein
MLYESLDISFTSVLIISLHVCFLLVLFNVFDKTNATESFQVTLCWICYMTMVIWIKMDIPCTDLLLHAPGKWELQLLSSSTPTR